jgi:peptide-methionine (R)-S-oxide reductase
MLPAETRPGVERRPNSAALRFIPISKLEEAGYGEYKKLFDQASSK